MARRGSIGPNIHVPVAITQSCEPRGSDVHGRHAVGVVFRTTAFDAWLKALRDPIGKARILARVRSAEIGNFGDSNAVGEGVYKMRIHVGPGYRVYYCRRGELTCSCVAATSLLNVKISARWRKVLKFFALTGLAVLISAVAGRAWFYGFLGLGSAFVPVVHGWWLPRNGINPWTGEPRERYYQLRGWKVKARAEPDASSRHRRVTGFWDSKLSGAVVLPSFVARPTTTFTLLLSSAISGEQP